MGTYAVSLLNGLSFAALLYTISVGLSLILGMMGVLNLAHGTLYLLGAYVAVSWMGDGASWTGFLIAVAVCVAVGLVVGSGLAGMLSGRFRRSEIDQVLLTLGASLVGGQLILMYYGGSVRSIAAPPGLDGFVMLLGHSYPLYRIALIVVGAVLVVAITLVLDRSAVGAIVRATVADPDMVRSIGIDSRKVTVGVFAAGATLATVGGLLGGPMLGAAPGLDGQILLIALVVVVIGGLGSVRGAAVGAILIGEVQEFGTRLVPEFAPFLLAGAMALVLAVRPAGLFGERPVNA
ncbi:branched-chain amino acid ABC transporter permease [Rhodococcus erythropolis]|uniref:branched-chain amino acid ABC transporter permease n=1 Tax=Rhodococcus erythropolis TaxID=1833 RepID=UPI001BE8B561|nr:branched-chain amino acid ABC transporter permease [Rhodococcus erythropolis]MBT2268979.1 branched-chain amino acid ABC transporter permease [Rhodococcus erythropolis]